MPVLFRLVGSVNSRVLEIRKNMFGEFNLGHFHSIFKSYGLEDEELDEIKFVMQSETLKDKQKIIKIDMENTLNIFVFSINPYIKEKLSKIFFENCCPGEEPEKKFVDLKKPEPELQKKIYVEEKEIIPELDEESVSNINKEILKLFESDDFKSLIKIYYTNQDIMKTFFNYINSGDIIKFSVPEGAKTKTFEKEIQTLKSLGINENDDEIRKCLITCNGHLNLALRKLLVQKCILFN
jgi:hypothetical protein